MYNIFKISYFLYTSPKAQYDILSKSIDIYPIIKDIIINKKLGVLKYEKGSIY